MDPSCNLKWYGTKYVANILILNLKYTASNEDQMVFLKCL